MTLSYEELKAILSTHFSLTNKAFYEQPLYISFRVDSTEHQVDDTITYLATDGNTVAIDINKQEELLGIEII